MDYQFISLKGKFVTSQTTSFSRMDINSRSWYYKHCSSDQHFFHGNQPSYRARAHISLIVTKLFLLQLILKAIGKVNNNYVNHNHLPPTRVPGRGNHYLGKRQPFCPIRQHAGSWLFNHLVLKTMGHGYKNLPTGPEGTRTFIYSNRDFFN